MKLLTYNPLYPQEGEFNTAVVYDYSLATMIPLERGGFIWYKVERIRMVCYVEIVSCIISNLGGTFAELLTT